MTMLRHLWILLLGLLAIAIGYVALAAGRLSWGPILLVGGYCVVMPVFIWRLFRSGAGEPSDVAAATGDADSGVGE